MTGLRDTGNPPRTTLPVPPPATVETPRGRTWPAQQTVIESYRAQTFRSQEWRPGCFRCGERADGELDWDGATAWWHEHRERCACAS